MSKVPRKVTAKIVKAKVSPRDFNLGKYGLLIYWAVTGVHMSTKNLA
jgi:hypothetical protein